MKINGSWGSVLREERLEMNAYVGSRFTMLYEPPGADPHAGWCGGWGLKTPGYPIRWCFLISTFYLGHDSLGPLFYPSAHTPLLRDFPLYQ